RIVKTMGMRLTKLKPFGGFCAETGAAAMLFLASALGVPVATTNTITGGIVGVGYVTRPGSVRWGVALRIVWAWLFTIQSSALIAAGIYAALRALGVCASEVAGGGEASYSTFRTPPIILPIAQPYFMSPAFLGVNDTVTALLSG